MPAMTRRNSHEEVEAEEDFVRQGSGRTKKQEEEDEKYTPKTTPKLEAKPPQDGPQCNFDLVSMAEAEEESIAMDRRQMSAMEAEAMGGRRKAQPVTEEPTTIAVETPKNTHHLAGSAEAEEEAWGLDRQVSAAVAKGEAVVLPRQLPSLTSTAEEPTTIAVETPKINHHLAGSAEAEEEAWGLDRQVSAAVQKKGGP